jgi:hypothetical protein
MRFVQLAVFEHFSSMHIAQRTILIQNPAVQSPDGDPRAA